MRPVNRANDSISHSRDTAMSDTLHPKPDSDLPLVYQIRIEGHLGHQWAEWFGDLTVTLEDNGDTLLSGPVADQAALHGLLRKVRDLGTPLLSVVCVPPSQTDAPGSQKTTATEAPRNKKTASMDS